MFAFFLFLYIYIFSNKKFKKMKKIFNKFIIKVYIYIYLYNIVRYYFKEKREKKI